MPHRQPLTVTGYVMKAGSNDQTKREALSLEEQKKLANRLNVQAMEAADYRPVSIQKGGNNGKSGIVH